MRVENTEARIHHVGEHLSLSPGDNDVDEKHWAEAKKIKLVELQLRAGVFVEKPAK